MIYSKTIVILALVTSLVGCNGGPPLDAMQLSPTSLKTRQMQTKKFDTQDEANMLTASMEVLQDMGFMIKEAESKLGVIVGSKKRETDNRGERVALITLSILAGSGSLSGIESAHKIKVSLVTMPDKNNKSTSVRVNFQRQVYDMMGDLVKLETINDPELYTGFFSKLSKSVFLEAHEV